MLPTRRNRAGISILFARDFAPRTLSTLWPPPTAHTRTRRIVRRIPLACSAYPAGKVGIDPRACIRQVGTPRSGFRCDPMRSPARIHTVPPPAPVPLKRRRNSRICCCRFRWQMFHARIPCMSTPHAPSKTCPPHTPRIHGRRCHTCRGHTLCRRAAQTPMRRCCIHRLHSPSMCFDP